MNYKTKAKTISRIKALEQELTIHHSSNAAFFSQFNADTLVNEVSCITWKFNKCLSFFLYSLKDIVSVKGKPVSGCCESLKDYVSPYSSTVFKTLKANGSINLFNCCLDEFGMGGSGLYSYLGQIHNPLKPGHMIYGSSSGSAYVVNQKLVDFSIASDTGDSARVPASHTNIYGFKPSYGTISRYGVFPFCSQFDTVSIVSSDLDTIAQVFSVVSHPDPHDLTTLKVVKKNYRKSLEKKFDKVVKIAVLKETFTSSKSRTETSKYIEQEFNNTLDVIGKDVNFELHHISFDEKLLKLASLIYMVVSYAESISNYSTLNGLLFPFSEQEDKTIKPIYLKDSTSFKDLLLKTRSKIGKEVKFRQTLGLYFLDGENYENIYLRSKKILTLFNQKVKKLFEKYDVVLSPTCDYTASKIADHKTSYSPDNTANILLLANFCGLPAISIPWITKDDLPVGLHVMCKRNSDDLLLQVASHLKKIV